MIRWQRIPFLTSSNEKKNHLRIVWWTASGLCLLILLSGFWVLIRGSPRLNSAQWMLQSLVILVFILGLLRFALCWNYHPDRKILHRTLGYGTWLSIIRGTLIAMLAGYLFQPCPESKFFPGRFSWAPGLIYLTAAALDFADGRIARACRRETRLGAFLDINLDALGLLVAPLVAVWYGQLPAAYLSVGCAYYVYRGGIWLRKKRFKPIAEPGPWRGARIIAGVQMGFVGFALLPILRPPVTTLAAYMLMIPLLAGFGRDWMVVCGYLNSK
jgi:CDP-diacylglycerol--glycerol-3-phosphate 3-phosphatidyltransferase